MSRSREFGGLLLHKGRRPKTTPKERAMRPGTYRDKSGNLVTVKRTTDGGYLIQHADGTTTVIGGRA